MKVTRYDDVEPFTTKDGSEIREWAGRAATGTLDQSLAEASLPPGAATTEHFHPVAEELYLITAGSGRLKVDGEERDIRSGDCAVIPPGARHKLWNTGDDVLRVVCACAPAYSHEDTVLTEDEPTAGDRP
jgi:mannose-6-phosphate isomerase-like protein (cupin superfamily)